MNSDTLNRIEHTLSLLHGAGVQIVALIQDYGNGLDSDRLRQAKDGIWVAMDRVNQLRSTQLASTDNKVSPDSKCSVSGKN
jgi:hypothetical protein